MTEDKLKAVGLKVTAPRIKILELMSQADAHLSAEAIYQKLRDAREDVVLATVYRVLGQFEDAGLVKRHRFEPEVAVFELNEGDHHDHLVCVRCSQVVEFVDEVIEAHQEQIATKHGFQITDHALTLYGICQRCHACCCGAS